LVSYKAVIKLSLFDLAEYFLYSFKLFENKNEQEYIFAFLDELLNFNAKNSSSIIDFVVFWKENKARLSIVSKPNDAVTITTIHKSKGLQYPVVIIPEAQWHFNLNKRETIWVDLKEIDYQELTENGAANKLQIASLNQKADLKSTAIGSQYRREEELAFLEAINKLYVATTRAEERLYILTKYKIPKATNSKKEADSNSISIKDLGDLFYHFLSEKIKITFESTNYIISQGINQKQVKKVEIANNEPVFIDNYRFTKSVNVKISDKINKNINELNNIDRGKKIHHILQNVETIADVEGAVNKALIAGLLKQEESDEINKKIISLLSIESITNYYKIGVVVKNEMEILLPDGNTQRPDRVNFSNSETTIIDYKTGHERPEYKTQLRYYGTLMKEMGYPNPKMFLLYLDEAKVVAVA
jgi:ATP-dependent helicase/nuclease subunit A